MGNLLFGILRNVLGKLRKSQTNLARSDFKGSFMTFGWANLGQRSGKTVRFRRGIRSWRFSRKPGDSCQQK
jgi:hypothetical protein